jgi:oligopeptidase B
VTVRDLTDGTEHAIEFPDPVFSVGPGGNAEFDAQELRFSYRSLRIPDSVYDYDMRTRARVLRKQNAVLGGYASERFETHRLWAPAPDGALIPISLVKRTDVPRDRTAPALLYGYGSYEHSIDPTFSIARLSLLERGVVFAIAHIRGGGEMGRPWYEQGKLLRKRNTFSDFIAAAEYLIAEGWVAPSRLAIRGGSAGGLLMGAVANERPDLFAAVVAEVPFVDVVNTMSDPTLPLTVTEWEEWGNPLEPEYAEYMRSYAPYENVAAKEYPPMLVTAGLNDPRVAYWEPAKWVAKLRATATGTQPIVLKTEMGAGHMGPSGRYEKWKDEAFVLAFVLDQLGVTG